jgi:hypothetical protein
MVCKDMTLHKITEFYAERFSACPNITSEFSAMAVFISYVKQNNDLYKTRRHAHDLLLHQASFIVRVTAHEMSPLKKV